MATCEVIAGADEPPLGYEPWIVKIVAPADRDDAGPLEDAYSLMARSRRPATDPRAHLRQPHPFEFPHPAADYADLIKATSLLTHDQRQVARAYRRLAFNVAAHNRDDHVKNLAFTLDERSGEWWPAHADTAGVTRRRIEEIAAMFPKLAVSF